MKFRFPLQTVLRVRRHEEDAQKKKLAESLRVVQAVEDDIQERVNDLKKLSETPIPDAFTPKVLEMRYAYMHGLHKQRFELEKDLKKARDAAEKERVKLVENHRKTKILENLEHRQHLQFVHEENRLEQLELNEIATIRFNRNREKHHA